MPPRLLVARCGPATAFAGLVAASSALTSRTPACTRPAPTLRTPSRGRVGQRCCRVCGGSRVDCAVLCCAVLCCVVGVVGVVGSCRCVRPVSVCLPSVCASSQCLSPVGVCVQSVFVSCRCVRFRLVGRNNPRRGNGEFVIEAVESSHRRRSPMHAHTDWTHTLTGRTH